MVRAPAISLRAALLLGAALASGSACTSEVAPPPGGAGPSLCTTDRDCGGGQVCAVDGTCTLPVGDPGDAPPADDPPADDPPADDPPVDDPPADPCQPVEVDIFLLGDCLSVSCPAATPVPVGCNVLFSPGDDRGCVAHAPGDSDVYFQAGDQCNVGVVGGTLLCQAVGCGGGAVVALDAGNCPINKPVDIYAANPDGCPDLH